MREVSIRRTRLHRHPAGGNGWGYRPGPPRDSPAGVSLRPEGTEGQSALSPPVLSLAAGTATRPFFTLTLIDHGGWKTELLRDNTARAMC